MTARGTRSSKNKPSSAASLYETYTGRFKYSTLIIRRHVIRGGQTTTVFPVTLSTRSRMVLLMPGTKTHTSGSEFPLVVDIAHAVIWTINMSFNIGTTRIWNVSWTFPFCVWLLFFYRIACDLHFYETNEYFVVVSFSTLVLKVGSRKYYIHFKMFYF